MTYTNIHSHTDIHAWMQTFIHPYMHTSICIHIHMHIYVYTFMIIQIHILTHIHIYTYTNIRIYPYTYTHTHTYMYICIIYDTSPKTYLSSKFSGIDSVFLNIWTLKSMGISGS